MISATCDSCGKRFNVPEAYAGKTAKCKICGGRVKFPELEIASVGAEGALAHEEAAREDRGSQIENHQTEAATAVDHSPPSSILNPPSSLPPSAPSAASAAAPIRIPMRTRRLRADAESMRNAFRDSQYIKVEALEGDPPEAYRVLYHIDSLEPGPDGKPIPRHEHEVEIQLTSEYPRLSPKCKIRTPIFHPNFDPTTICVGDHWTAGERLVDLVVRIGEMIAFQAYNIQSPLDAEAAMWTDLNRGLLPTDARELRPADLE
jgi:ubiquitin-protein ligase